MSSNVRRGLVCVTVVMNSLAAGGVFTFPLMAPNLAIHLKLSQPQLSTIVLGGLIGQYPLASLVGKVIDSSRGQNICSGIAALLLSLGFGMFGREVQTTDISEPSPSFRLLAFLFFLAGLGTVFSCFSSMFAASKNFPKHSGLATGASMSLFGLSPLFLSIVATRYFTHQQTGLNVSGYLGFLATFAFMTHAFGAMVLTTPSLVPAEVDGPIPDLETSVPQEDTPLLKSDAGLHPAILPQVGSSLDLARDTNFILLFCASLLTLGACEMIMGNLGTIVLSLPASSTSSTDAATSSQVRLVSLANTCSRFVVGAFADYLSPVPVFMPSGMHTFPRKHYFSRVVFLAAANGLLALMFLWMALGVRTQSAVWTISLGTGMVYGSTFVLLPTILSSIWGVTNIGRNFGILSYAPFVGTSVFSYIYAFGAKSSINETQGACYGVQCWRRTAWVCVATSLVALVGQLVLVRRWRGRV